MFFSGFIVGFKANYAPKAHICGVFRVPPWGMKPPKTKEKWRKTELFVLILDYPGLLNSLNKRFEPVLSPFFLNKRKFIEYFPVF